jgi:threonine dehydrogenase-like Zn-dependent dehydrogenase
MDHTAEAVALFAVQRDDYVFNHKSLTIIGYPGHHREAAEYALELITSDRLQLAPLASVELPLEAYQQAVELLRNQKAVKVCFVPGMMTPDPS